MCGICGYVGREVSGALERMCNLLVHRGPDAGGIACDREAGVYFGHRRLSILDIAGGAQPMSTVDGELTVVFNGEVYNFAELRTQLEREGHRFESDHSDTEVLLHGYRQWGETLPGKLNGMWAFVLHDRRRKRLFGSRDRFGKKPFFYARTSETFLFASELRALLAHPSAPRTLSTAALKKYFGYGYIPAPHTLVEGIRKLPGGHSFTLDLGSNELHIYPYWRFELDPFPAIPADPVEEWGKHLLDLLRTATKRRLVADVPVGIFLSGGIDSSTVTALAARERPALDLETFTIGFQESSFDESAHAARVADLLGTRHHVKQLSIDAASALVPEILDRLDEPMGDSSLLPTYLLAGFAREHVTVALGGDGGDELLAGYDPFRALRLAALYQKCVPRPLHTAVKLAVARLPVSHRNMSLDFRLKRAVRGLDFAPQLWCPIWMAPLAQDDLVELFREPCDPEDLYSEAITAWESCTQPDLVNRTMQFYIMLYLQDDILVKTDRASMMHGLEVRSPFLDIDVVDFVRRIPAVLKFRGGAGKWILKEAARDILPPDILGRRKKGFGVPVGQWLKDGALEFAAKLPTLGSIAPFAEGALARHRAGKADEHAFLWNALCLAHWKAKM